MSLDEFRNKIISGDALTVLHEMPDESAHCCITSPPYWGLRKYDAPDSVWGGSKDCEHEWGHEKQSKYDGEGVRWRGSFKTGGTPNQKDIPTTVSQGSLCVRCGAWRGQLGLEPTPDCGRLFMELRSDLSQKDRERVVSELRKLGVIE